MRMVAWFLMGTLACLPAVAAAQCPPGHVREAGLVLEDLRARLGDFDTLVVAEDHYQAQVQCFEAALVEKAAELWSGRLEVAWEFLDESAQPQIDRQFAGMVAGTVTPESFLAAFGLQNENVYAPVLAAARSHATRLLGVNLPRTEKRKVIAGGLAALPARYLPEGFQPGSPSYRERFDAAMGMAGGHSSLDGYFLAQTLTDEYMAAVVARRAAPVILVTGAFHAEYRDGVVASLVRRERRVAVVRVTADGSLPDRSERYGEVADAVVRLP